MQVEGIISHIGEEESVGNNGFRKRLLVVETDEQYPQLLPIEFVQDKCDLLNALKEKQKVKVSINLRGRKWTNPEGIDKYFGSIGGWRVEALSEGSTNTPTAPPEEGSDDLPF